MKSDVVYLSIEMSQNLTRVERSGYTFLDWLADIGGMQGILITFFSIFVNFFNGNLLDNYLVSRLYLYSPSQARD